MLSKFRLGQVFSLMKTKNKGLLSLGALITVLGWRLGSLPANLSSDELTSINYSLRNALRSPINLPYHLLQDALVHIHRSVVFGRFASVITAVAFAVSFYYLLKAWFGKSIALLSTGLLVFTPYFIISARNATPTIMFFVPIIVMAAYSSASRRIDSRLPVLLLALSTLFALYVPGMIWLVGLMSVVRFHRIKNLVVNAMNGPKHYAIFCLGSLVILSPLLIGLATSLATLKHWALVPDNFLGAGSIAKSFLWSLAAFVFESRQHQALIIERLPLLNIAQTGLMVFGIYAMCLRLKKELFIILGLCAFIALLSGVNHNYSVLALALPMLMIIIGMGLRYLFIEWRRVFPLNPLAKAFAIGLMSALVAVHVLVGIRYSLIAWPATVATSHTSVLK